ncbi:hydantoinase B/oxoprolinase family protein [Muricoccus aerilatus]|uniref:hydantoinase B/oxoprolinase family protein n=1 Tax=Muricoccus aerilatus TaxID=452982 RepID=UPI000A6FAA59|nr:hydantoinase B/oxoprolinase family protein [Roseomonas aerilata]
MSELTRPVRIAVDIGGTFTDLQVLDLRNGAVRAWKTPTTPLDPSEGLLRGVREAAARFGFTLSDVGLLLHGTTIATNAVLERQLARGALLTTAGFEDVLEITRHYRRDLYALDPDPYPVLVSRDRRLGVAERIRADGSVECPIDEAALPALLARLDALEVECVAISLLHAYANPVHERRLRDLLLAAHPGLAISLSSEISPEIREYERSSTTVLNALLIPVVRAYLARLERRLGEDGFAPTVFLVQSNGGVCGLRRAAEQPARLLLSGPSGGALAAERLSHLLDRPDLVAVDMGGTSYDVSVVLGGRVSVVTQGEVDRLPVRLPMVEMRTIGAGGGSIASVSSGGRLTVGPRSAGARPGPVAYGRGGTEPTVTDANLALGRLDPDYFLGGTMALDMPATRRAIAGRIAAPLGLGEEEAAEGILRVTDGALGAAVRLSLFEKGLDPRDFTLLSFGGAGGLHATAVAEEVGIREVAFPREPGTLSAYGILFGDLVQDISRTRVTPATPEGLAPLATLLEELRGEAEARLTTDGVAPDDRAIEVSADMRYHGQAFELLIPWGDVAAPDEAALARLLAAFHDTHRRRFSYADEAEAVEIVTLRVSAIGRLPRREAAEAPPAARPARKGTRRSWEGGAWRDVPVWDREALTPADRIEGPALVEESFATHWIGRGWTASLGPTGALLARRGAETARAVQTATLGPVEIEVIRNALTAAAAEMDVTVWRTSRSTIVRELLDYSTAVFDADGNNLAQSARIPGHLNSMSHLLRELLDKHVDAGSWGPDDVVATNDPYCGGQHLPDIVTYKPVFHEGRRIAFVGTLCHHIDMGGLAAGSYAATATEIFQEGLRIPPLKIVENGKPNAGVWAMIRQNVRKPALVLGDLASQLASLEVGAAAIRRLATRYGADGMIKAGSCILDNSEAAMRAAIGRMPDGIYEFQDFLDDDGVVLDQPLRLHARLEIAGDSITADLSGCSPQAKGPVNATLASSAAAVLFAVMSASDEPLAANAGCYRPVSIVAPEGLCVNARHPAPVAHRVAVSHRLLNAVHGALHGAVPDRIPAAYYGNSYVCTFQTVAADGSREVLVEIEIGGSGAHPRKDGVNAYASGMHNNSNIPVEMIESGMPLTIAAYGLLPGSGGAGRRRGGLGLFREWRVDSESCILTTNMDRFHHAPYGLAGGHPASLGRLLLIRDGVATPIRPKTDGLLLRRGDVVRLETSGGGGFGPPPERDPRLAMEDTALGYVNAAESAGLATA